MDNIKDKINELKKDADKKVKEIKKKPIRKLKQWKKGWKEGKRHRKES